MGDFSVSLQDRYIDWKTLNHHIENKDLRVIADVKGETVIEGKIFDLGEMFRGEMALLHFEYRQLNEYIQGSSVSSYTRKGFSYDLSLNFCSDTCDEALSNGAMHAMDLGNYFFLLGAYDVTQILGGDIDGDGVNDIVLKLSDNLGAFVYQLPMGSPKPLNLPDSEYEFIPLPAPELKTLSKPKLRPLLKSKLFLKPKPPEYKLESDFEDLEDLEDLE